MAAIVNTGPRCKVAFGLFGAGGCARGVMPLLLEGGSGLPLNASPESNAGTAYFVQRNPGQPLLNSVEVLSEEQFFSLGVEELLFNIAIADSRLREKLVRTCIDRGAVPRSIRSKHCIVYDGAHIGEGAILCANSVITPNVQIGRFFHLNLLAYVEHDCIIGDFVTFGPNVNCNGYVHIGDHAYIGAGAMLKNGSSGKPLVIGPGAVVGMGAVVTKDVPPGVTVAGNPARPIERR